MRRIVTGEDAQGKSIFVSDGPAPNRTTDPGTPSGRVLRVKGRGIADKAGQGDLLAKVTVVVPHRLSDAARKAVEVLRDEEAGADPRADLFARARRD